MSGVFVTNIEEDTLNNKYFRKVLFTAKNQQVVIMSIKPSEDIPFEIHPDNDQFIRVEKGKCVALIGKNRDEKYDLQDGSIIVIPAGTWHQIINKSLTDELKLYTIYSPPHHPPNKIDVNRPVENGHMEQNGAASKQSYYIKYLKYKNKYLSLKNSFQI